MSKPTRAQVMTTAASQIGYRDNTGARFWNFLFPSWIGGAWCACFVMWSIVKSGGDKPAPGISGWFYTPTGRATAQRNGTYRAPTEANAAKMKPADAVYFDWQDDGVTDHIAFFERYLGNGLIQTIEGNTSSGNAGSQSNGRGVWRRVRRISDVSGFVDLGYLYADPAPAIAGKLTEDGIWGVLTSKALQTALAKATKTALTVDGIVGVDTTKALQTFLNAHSAALTVDGVWGEQTTRALQTWLNNRGYANLTVDGAMGAQTTWGVQHALNVGGIA